MTFFNTVFVTFVNALSITLIISSHTITQSSIIIFCTHDTFYVHIDIYHYSNFNCTMECETDFDGILAISPTSSMAQPECFDQIELSDLVFGLGHSK